MKRTYKLFKLFLPIILAMTFTTAIIGIFIFKFTYNQATGINFMQAAPIITFMFLAATVVLCFYFIFKVKHIYVTKIRRDSNALKFASALAFVVVSILTVYDFYRLLASGMVISPSKAFKVIRILTAIPFLIYLVINALPKRMFRQKIVIPVPLQNISALGAILWSLSSILAVWFFESTAYAYFKVVHTLFYALFTLFIVTEVKTQLIKPSAKLHIATALLLFTVSFPLTLSIVIGNVDNLTHTGISLFEYLAALALCIYAVSKVYAYKYTIKFVMDTEKSSTHHSHKHRRHKADNASQENPTSTETK